MTKGADGAERSPELDPSASLDRMEDALDRLTRTANGIPLELYNRVAWTVRVEVRPGEPGVSKRLGADEGTALRVLRPGGAFAASSGGSVDDLAERVLIRVENDRVPTYRPRRTGVRRGRLFDRDEAVRLPTVGELVAWLEKARAGLPGGVDSCWVEAAATLESWVSTRGFSGARLRCRGWALARLEGERPLVLAHRRWSRLPSRGWRDLWNERRTGTGGGETGARVVILGTEASARLVAALVRAVHAPVSTSPAEVGPGWRLCDRPRADDALFGGTFDDSGEPTREVELANGAKTTGDLAGPGHDRRPSFRDPPQPWPAHVVVDPKAEPAPAHFMDVSNLAIHPAGQEWIVEMGGDSLSESRKYIRVRPDELIRRCLGGSGPNRLSHLGVSTPRLIFEL